MAIITIKINERSKAGKAFKVLLEVLTKQPGIEIIENNGYNPKFVKMVKEADASKNRTEINPKDVWGSLGLH